MNYRVSNLIFNICRWGTLALVALYLYFLQDWIGFAAFGLFILGFAQTKLFCKCPHCGGSLYSNRGLPDFCPHCNEKLDG